VSNARRRRRGGSKNPVRWASWAAIPSFTLSFAPRGGDSRGAVGAAPLTIGRGGQKKSRALTQPFKTPRKSRDNDDEENGFSFQNMMSMMMYQNRAELEQRERQSRIDAEQRDREYQLHREEMAIAREDARAQRQLMNVMMMAMLNKNGGGIVLNLDLLPAAL
jgi:hypothetical protein